MFLAIAHTLRFLHDRDRNLLSFSRTCTSLYELDRGVPVELLASTTTLYIEIERYKMKTKTFKPRVPPACKVRNRLVVVELVASTWVFAN